MRISAPRRSPSAPRTLLGSRLSALGSRLSALGFGSWKLGVGSWPSVLRISDGMWRVSGPRALVDADGTKAARLEHANQLQPDHLQQRQERHDHERARAVAVAEEIL